MWRRVYLLLIVLRLYFALRPSYLHPDEHFQGPEVIAGSVFGYPVRHTWEFTAENPIRSVFPLWPVYGLPMLVLRWLWEGSGNGLVKPWLVFWTLRALMFLLSFILEDWAIHELVESPRQRRVALLLTASSYVTWTWQVHTFSNSIETLIVLWTLVLMKRLKNPHGPNSGLLASAVLAIVFVFGVFNRITYPAYVLLPALTLIPGFLMRPLLSISFITVGALTACFAIAVDTAFYKTGDLHLSDLYTDPIITPLNNLRYNIEPANLALHGTHPFYQHFLVNLPQLLGPASLLIIFSSHKTMPLFAALFGILVLSGFSHQEARFLLPAVPLLLSAVRFPLANKNAWLAAWIVFNSLLGVLMGVYHQAGVVPAQIWLEDYANSTTAYWWKTYSPPTWLLDGRIDDVKTVDLMGLPRDQLQTEVCSDDSTPNVADGGRNRLLVAPHSATFLDRFLEGHVTASTSAQEKQQMRLERIWTTQDHLNLDDMDFGDDGIFETLSRVIGRRGLAVYRVNCIAPG